MENQRSMRLALDADKEKRRTIGEKGNVEIVTFADFWDRRFNEARYVD